MISLSVQNKLHSHEAAMKLKTCLSRIVFKHLEKISIKSLLGLVLFVICFNTFGSSISNDPVAKRKAALLTKLLANQQSVLRNDQIALLKKYYACDEFEQIDTKNSDAIEDFVRVIRRPELDQDYQEKCLDALGNQIDIALNPINYAKLNDTILIEHGQAQKYGTQLHYVGSNLAPYPTKQGNSLAERVDCRRNSIGLVDMENYLKEIETSLEAGRSLQEQMSIGQIVRHTEITLPLVHDQIEEMAREDQQARSSDSAEREKSAHDLRARSSMTDKQNLEKIRSIFDRYGYPTAAQIGRDGVTAFWLLIQHADNDSKLQRKMLLGAKMRMDELDLPKSIYAYLIDRNQYNLNASQTYGTQLKIVGAHILFPGLINPREVDAKRASMCLPPLQDYIDAYKRLVLHSKN